MAMKFFNYLTIKSVVIASILFFINLGLIFSQEFLQYRNNFQLQNWKFYKGDINSAGSGDWISLEGWEDITIPHTWNAKDVLTEGPRYYQGIGWYRTEFNLERNDKNNRYFIRFEGVSMVADFFINGEYLGKHKGGYSAFCYEITNYLRNNEINRISVRVDNSSQMDVAPYGTHLYPLFGGIYRPVNVFSTGEICISPLDYASSGVYIKPVKVSEEEADIEVETLLNYQLLSTITSKSDELLPPKGKKGIGLYGEYFSNNEFKGKPVYSVVDEEISFNYFNEGPFDDMPNDNFSAIWTGRFIPEKTGKYKFILKSDDGSKFYLDNELIIDHWGMHAAWEKSNEVFLEAGKEKLIKIEYNEFGGEASIFFGWIFMDEEIKSFNGVIQTSIVDQTGQVIEEKKQNIIVNNNQQLKNIQKIHLTNPHLWNAKADPYLYTLNVKIIDRYGTLMDEVEQPLGLRYFKVDKENGLFLNGKPYHLYGVCRHQEWEGLGPALTEKEHKKDFELIMEVGANGMRLAHYQQADLMYALADKNGLVVWAEIPNTPAYKGEYKPYMENCKEQLIELIKQNYNHPSILFWGLYNEIPIPAEDVKYLHEIAKNIDPYRLTTAADYTQPTDRHYETDIMAWNWYFGWYYDNFDKYNIWYNNLYKEYPDLTGGLSEYGAGGCISQQQENPQRPDPTYGRVFPEQYQRLYHEEVWKNIQNRHDIWCKFIWNMFDFSWTNAFRGDRPYINHKGLVTHDRQVKKDAFYFYKANWSDEPVLYILSRRNIEHNDELVAVEVYTNLDEVELYANGKLISKKKMESEIHKIGWENIQLKPGRNYINVIGYKGNMKFTDNCEWIYR
ncbi:MAG: DUF4982 domain-containing protein [Bacteroidales bacterium]|nr:DUF4982 domain-containing protein [Bacteroidales bacterium]